MKKERVLEIIFFVPGVLYAFFRLCMIAAWNLFSKNGEDELATGDISGRKEV